MIEAHELTKRYGDTTAVHSLSFTIAPGTVTGFLGPNGAGKSTTMRMIMGLDWPTSGHRHRQQSPARARTSWRTHCTPSRRCERALRPGCTALASSRRRPPGAGNGAAGRACR